VREVDCAIVGGGPAGLSAAVNLARMRRSVLVIDDRDGRSLWGQTNRNYLGFPDGIAAADIRLAGRKQAANYGAAFLNGRVVAASRDDGVFRLRVEARAGRDGAAGRAANAERDLALGDALGEERADGPEDIVARTVIIATGVRDDFPRFPGWADCVGRSLFWCITCDGYETTGKVVVVVGYDEDSVETALDLLDFTDRVTIVAGRSEGFDVPPERMADLSENGIEAYGCSVVEYVNADGQIEAVVLEDGKRLPVEMVFFYRRPSPRNEVAVALGLELNELGHVIVDTVQQTDVPGIYAAGDVTNLHDHLISAAVHEGTQAACAANYHLYRPVQKAPERRRAEAR
jgi:thioredoxin reductase (NADPH)